MAGSSRMRSYQYFPLLEKEGFKITASPFFDDKYLSDFYKGKKNPFSVIQSYFRRLFALFTVFKYDGIVIEKELFPYFPAWAEGLLKVLGIKYIADYDDAVFHNYDMHPNALIRFFLKNKIAKVMKYSSCVIAGNKYLSDYAKQAGAKNIEIIPTVVDLSRYPLKEKSKEEKFIVGWIGTKTTFEKHLLPHADWIEKLSETNPDIEFHIVGPTEGPDLGESFIYIPWSETTEVENIRKMDVGLMPLPDTPWERGKCAYKLIQYAACGVTGLASDVGMNKEVIEEGQSGYLISGKNEWPGKILYLKNHPALCADMGKRGRKTVEEKFCLQITAENLVKIFQEYF